MNAFFNPENVESVYVTLRDAVLAMSDSIVAQQAADGGASVSVDAAAAAHDLINTVVMKARSGRASPSFSVSITGSEPPGG